MHGAEYELQGLSVRRYIEYARGSPIRVSKITASRSGNAIKLIMRIRAVKPGTHCYTIRVIAWYVSPDGRDWRKLGVRRTSGCVGSIPKYYVPTEVASPLPGLFAQVLYYAQRFRRTRVTPYRDHVIWLPRDTTFIDIDVYDARTGKRWVYGEAFIG